MEMHIVCHSTRYSNFTAALPHRLGIAVFAVLFKSSPSDNAALAVILDSVGAPALSSATLAPTALLPFFRQSLYYRYMGSLTTPGCTEGVVWTVFVDVLPVAQRQLDRLRAQRDAQGQRLERNFRAVQPLNGRRVAFVMNPVLRHLMQEASAANRKT